MRWVVQNCRMRFLLFVLLSFCAIPTWAAHGYALWDDLKYPVDFDHSAYVNPQAPKGGELRLVSNQCVSTFDKYNPFTVKGSTPAYLSNLMFDSLLTGSMDETASGYGLLAQDVQIAPDRLSATFKLRANARFHNGDPVLARDVKHNFDTLNGPPGVARLPQHSRRCGWAGRSDGTLPIQEAQPGTSAHGRRSAGF